MIGIARTVTRLLLFVAVTCYYIIILLLLRMLGMQNEDRTFVHAQRWGQIMNKILGITISTEGKINTEGALIVMNHRSYIDGPVIISHVKGTAVAKAEVGKWPVIGTALKLAYVILVNRENKESRLETRKSVRALLDKGFSIIIFPEGTSFKAPEMGDFRQGPFQVAAEGNFPIVPVAVEYQNYDDAWIGDDTFLPHFLKVFKKKKTFVKLCFGPEIRSKNPQQSLHQAHTWIKEKTAIMRTQFAKSSAAKS